jgi:hypothetical protein
MQPRAYRELVPCGHIRRVPPSDPFRTHLPWEIQYAKPEVIGDADTGAEDALDLVCILRISGLQPEQLHLARVSVDGRCDLEMGSVTDLRGKLIPAGVLIRSMSAIAGINGMAIDVQASNLPLEAVTVTLHVAVDDLSAANAVRVQVLCGNRVRRTSGLQPTHQGA